MRLKRLFWKVISTMQQNMLLPTGLRMSLLRLAGAQVHVSAKIAGQVFIGSNLLRMGKHSFVNVHCFLDGSAPITIGDFVHLGPYVRLVTGSHTISGTVLRCYGTSVHIQKPIEIKRGAWIGLGAIILPGVTIEEGCVVGAGSVVTRPTEPNGLYAGNPAKRIRDLPTTAPDENLFQVGRSSDYTRFFHFDF